MDQPASSGAGSTPLVSAIIPTVGRGSLVDAVESALAQTWANMEVVVSVDGDLQLLAGLDLPADARLKIVASGTHVGGQAARGRGVTASAGTFIALLDDDDYWYPQKITVQMSLAMDLIRKGAAHALLGCRTDVEHPDGRRVRTEPRRLPSPGETIPEYLFTRRHIRPGETAIGSSMLLFDRGLADAVPLGESMPNHDDWNWLMEVHVHTGIPIHFPTEPLARYTQNVAGFSASTWNNWATSSEWFLRERPNLSPRELADGLLCYSVPLAFQQRRWKGAAGLVRTSWREGSPGVQALIVMVLRCGRILLHLRRSRPTPASGEVPSHIRQ